MISPIPASVLIHEVSFEEYTGNDDEWSNSSFLAPVTVQNVLVQPSSSMSRDNNGEFIESGSLLFYDPSQSTPNIEFVKGSKITFDGKTMYIEKVEPIYALDPSIPHHIEVELK